MQNFALQPFVMSLISPFISGDSFKNQPTHKVLTPWQSTDRAFLGGRMRITVSGRRGVVEMTVEVMSILRGVYLVDASKTTGDSVDFYNVYAQITDIIKPLITADALRRPEEGEAAAFGYLLYEYMC